MLRHRYSPGMRQFEGARGAGERRQCGRLVDDERHIEFLFRRRTIQRVPCLADDDATRIGQDFPRVSYDRVSYDKCRELLPLLCADAKRITHVGSRAELTIDTIMQTRAPLQGVCISPGPLQPCIHLPQIEFLPPLDGPEVNRDHAIAAIVATIAIVLSRQGSVIVLRAAATVASGMLSQLPLLISQLPLAAAVLSVESLIRWLSRRIKSSSRVVIPTPTVDSSEQFAFGTDASVLVVVVACALICASACTVMIQLSNRMQQRQLRHAAVALLTAHTREKSTGAAHLEAPKATLNKAALTKAALEAAIAEIRATAEAWDEPATTGQADSEADEQKAAHVAGAATGDLDAPSRRYAHPLTGNGHAAAKGEEQQRQQQLERSASGDSVRVVPPPEVYAKLQRARMSRRQSAVRAESPHSPPPSAALAMSEEAENCVTPPSDSAHAMYEALTKSLTKKRRPSHTMLPLRISTLEGIDLQSTQEAIPGEATELPRHFSPPNSPRESGEVSPAGRDLAV